MSFYGKVLEKINVINCIKKERGAIFVLTALLLPIMFGCLGIAYDVGTLYMHKARLQNVADAAALAGGRAYLQSQTKPSGQDSVDGTMDYRSKDIANCTYKGGRSMTVKYEYGKKTTIDRGNTTQHPDADAAADNYIYNNIVNLGNTVYADKYSHFALNYGNATSKIFYRIGLYETVPLRFLPLITDKYSETVRAGAIAYVEPGMTFPGGDETTTTSYSIFDNLFTYSDEFHSVTATDNDGARMAFIGDIVYTHGSNTHDNYYTYSDVDLVEHLYENKGVTSGNKINDATIDTTFNTLDYLEALTTEKLKQTHVSLLDINHDPQTLKASDINNENSSIYLSYITGPNGETVWKGRTNDTPYIYQDNEYYAVDSSGNYVYVDGKKVCYQRIGDGNSKQYMPCIKDNGKYYVLTATNTKSDYYLETVNGATALCKDGNIFNYYRNGKYYNIDSYGNRFINENGEYYEVDENGNKKQANGGKYICYRAFGAQYLRCVKGDDGRYYLLQGNSQSKCFISDDESVYYDGWISGVHLLDRKLTYDESRKDFYYKVLGFNNYFNLDAPINANFQTFQGDLSAAITDDFSNRQDQDKYKAKVLSNIFYITHNMNIEIDQEVVGVDNPTQPGTPIYIIADGDDVTLKLNVYVSNKRPIVIVYTGHTIQLQVEKIDTGATFEGVIYAPYSTGGVHLHNEENATFKGNIIAYKIEIQNSGKSTWQQHNYLDNSDPNTYTDNDVAKVTEEVRKANENNSYDSLSQEIKNDILTTLGIDESKLKNMEWFNSLSYAEKQSFYRKWKGLYEKYKTNNAARNVLWPWNQHFKTDGSVGDEHLRLINFRTEYRENGDPNAVVDPFIYMTLGNPLAY